MDKDRRAVKLQNTALWRFASHLLTAIGVLLVTDFISDASSDHDTIIRLQQNIEHIREGHSNIEQADRHISGKLEQHIRIDGEQEIRISILEANQRRLLGEQQVGNR